MDRFSLDIRNLVCRFYTSSY